MQELISFYDFEHWHNPTILLCQRLLFPIKLVPYVDIEYFSGPYLTAHAFN